MDIVIAVLLAAAGMGIGAVWPVAAWKNSRIDYMRREIRALEQMNDMCQTKLAVAQCQKETLAEDLRLCRKRIDKLMEGAVLLRYSTDDDGPERIYGIQLSYRQLVNTEAFPVLIHESMAKAEREIVERWKAERGTKGRDKP